MKKLICAALIMVFSATAFAQELKISGEAKTGIDWREERYVGKDEPESLNDPVRMHSRDDAGGNQGRLRINLDYEGNEFFGFRARLDWENWSFDERNPGNVQPKWKYAFGYANFFDNQMTVAVGKLGGSPWSTGGPEMWKELEVNTNGGGMRVEWKPGFIPEQYGRFNVGFVLNWVNGVDDSGSSREANLLELLRETVLGFSYTHSLFMIRFAYRLDSDMDIRVRGTEIYGREGDEFIYRIEEYALRNLVPGLSIWALGAYEGMFADASLFYHFVNWMFIQYEPPELGSLTTPFTVQVRLGLDYIAPEDKARSEFHVKPSFYWHFFNKLLSVGAMFSYRQDYGTKMWAGSPYQQMEVEPKIQLNFTSSYIAFAYNWKTEYQSSRMVPGKDPIKQTQFINLRFCIYY